jgi:hypothetical protein
MGREWPSLRARRERPRDRRANQAANKFATPHAIPRQINQWAPLKTANVHKFVQIHPLN